MTERNLKEYLKFEGETMSENDNTEESEIAFLKKRLDFVERQYKSLQLNQKYQREAFIEETNDDSFLLKLAPKRYASFEKLKTLESGRDWRKVMYRHPFKFDLWWTARKLQRNILPDSAQPADARQEDVWKKIDSILGKRKFSHIFILPFFTRGGSEKYMLQIMEEFCHQNLNEPILVLSNVDYHRVTWEEKFPIEVQYLDISILCHDFTLKERCHLAYHIGNTYSQKNAQWHFSIDGYSKLFFKIYKDNLKDKNINIYHYCNWAQLHSTKDGRVKITMDYAPYQTIRDGLQFISKIISDNQFIIDESNIFLKKEGLNPLKNATCLYTKSDIINDVSKNRDNNSRPRIFWASRLDMPKRLNLIFTIAKKMQTSLPDETLNVYGYSAVDTPFNDELLPPSAKFHGGFDGLNSLDIKPFDILVYTSYFDGLPNIILEAISLGMVVIAPDVSGIGEIIKDGETGILLPNDPDDDIMTDAYISALEKLLNNNDLRIELARNAQKLLRERHSSEIFAKNVQQIFGKVSFA